MLWSVHGGSWVVLSIPEWSWVFKFLFQYCGTHVFKGTGMYNWYLKQKKNLIKAKLSNPIQKTFLWLKQWFTGKIQSNANYVSSPLIKFFSFILILIYFILFIWQSIDQWGHKESVRRHKGWARSSKSGCFQFETKRCNRKINTQAPTHPRTH